MHAIRKTPVVKVVGLFKRKQGLSFEAFKQHYETVHCPIYENAISGPGVLRFARRYLSPISGLASDISNAADSKFDVIMEVWYKDQKAYETASGAQDPAFAKLAREDEQKLFDRASMTMYVTDDYETKEGPWNV